MRLLEKGDIASEITPEIKSNELLMQSQVDTRAIVLVEGKTDFRLFNGILSDDGWIIEYLDGKHNVVACIERLETFGSNRSIAILDRDPFDHLSTNSSAIYSLNADLDADLFAIDGLVDKIIKRNSNVRDVPVLENFGYSTWWDVVLSLVAPWTAARAYSHENSNGIALTAFPVHKIASQSTCAIDAEEFRKQILDRSRGLIDGEIVNSFLLKSNFDRMESNANGHHIAQSVAWIISEILKSEKMSAGTIENIARGALGTDELRELKVLRDLDVWAHGVAHCVWNQKCTTMSDQSNQPTF